jgi:hypothetical protein
VPTRPLGNDTITLLVPTATVDSRDNTTYYTYTDGAIVTGCSFQPFLMTEKFQEEFTLERESSRTFFRVFMPATDDTLLVTDKYRIRFDGVIYEVHAQAGEWRHFSGRLNHVAFLCKRRT